MENIAFLKADTINTQHGHNATATKQALLMADEESPRADYIDKDTHWTKHGNH